MRICLEQKPIWVEYDIKGGRAGVVTLGGNSIKQRLTEFELFGYASIKKLAPFFFESQ